MPEQGELLPMESEPDVIVARAREDARRIVDAHRRYGRQQRVPDKAVRAYLDALGAILGDEK